MAASDHLLGSWKEMDAVPVSKSCRVLRLLDVRAFELKSDVHGVFDRVWDALIHVDIKQHRVSIFRALEGEQISLIYASDALL